MSLVVVVSSGVSLLVILGVSKTGACPKTTIFLRVLGSLVCLHLRVAEREAVWVVLGVVGDGGGVVGVVRLTVGVVGESGVLVVWVIGVSIGLVCSGGGSCVGILYR